MENKLRQWRVPLEWTAYGLVYVEATTKEEAVQKALGPDVSLPSNPEYLPDSVRVDDEFGEVEMRADDGSWVTK